jgi:2'-5' RNA ligase
MRLFTALDIADDVRAALLELLRELSPAARFQWSPAANLHITTKFIGEWPAERRAELSDALGRTAKTGPIEIGISGVGWYPNPHSPRVLFAGVSAGTGLGELHRNTDAACEAVGIAREAKEYHPHVTLARTRTLEGLGAVRQRIAQRAGLEFGRFTARSFHLYESVPAPGGAEYKKLEEFGLL